MLKPHRLANKNFLSSLDITAEETLNIIELAKRFKNRNGSFHASKILIMPAKIFIHSL